MPSTSQIQRQMVKERDVQMEADTFQYLLKLNHILAKMRESNQGYFATRKRTEAQEKLTLEEEVAILKKDKRYIPEKVVWPDEGGVLTYYIGEPHPLKGFLIHDQVQKVDDVKKTLFFLLKEMWIVFKDNRFKLLLFALFFRKYAKKIFSAYLATMDYTLDEVRQKPERYCKSGREVYRVFSDFIDFYPDWKEDLIHLRSIVCMIWEYDDAYRYPGQDVLGDFNQENAKKNIVKELSRLIDIYCERDDRGTADKFLRAKKVLPLLKFMPKIKRAVQRFFLALDIDKIILDEADLYHANIKSGYRWKNLREQNNVI